MIVEWQLLAHLGALVIVVFVALGGVGWASRTQAIRDEADFRRSVLPFDADEGD